METSKKGVAQQVPAASDAEKSIIRHRQARVQALIVISIARDCPPQKVQNPQIKQNDVQSVKQGG
jgi:hypothetical protein